MKTKMLFLAVLFSAGFSVSAFSQCRTVTWSNGPNPCGGPAAGGIIGTNIQICMTFTLTGNACRVPPGSYTVCNNLSSTTTSASFCPPAPSEPGCSISITNITVHYGTPSTVPATGSSAGSLTGPPFGSGCSYDWCQTGTNTYAFVPRCLVGGDGK